MDTKKWEEEGAEALVILPGLLCDSGMFGAQLDAFPEAMVIDGFYGGADSLEAMADYVLDRIPPRVSLFGHSMGARVALEVCRMAPTRVVRLALADTGIHPVREGEPAKRHALRDIGRTQGFGALVDTWLPPMIGPERREDADLYQALRTMCLRAGQEVFEAQIEALLHRPDVEDVLSSLTCPVALMVGEDDAWAPPSQHQDIADTIAPHWADPCPLTVIPKAGHMAPAEAPEAFNAALRRWLKASVDAPSAA
ncbi:alpha/beta fold hydrolase [Novosphingobium decolorationis]|uniref:Alpha/beta hydrolase n=1 Tax=Novosphingobium decolorationis TaxID=2698673 RepID=A0ABX8E3V0_9SPHN|nr:alpha/beta hydrolase [Novosphingobium decolorationis]QVM83604.1 alpha/beta hydrolase [Novosphingobium decolorationis]